MSLRWITFSLVLHLIVFAAFLTADDKKEQPSDGTRATKVALVSQNEAKPKKQKPPAPVTPPVTPEPERKVKYAGAPTGGNDEKTKEATTNRNQTEDNSGPDEKLLSEGGKTQLQLAVKLLEDGEKLPGFQVPSLSIDDILSITQPSYGIVVAEFSNQNPGYVVVTLDERGDMVSRSAISGRVLIQRYASRAILLPGYLSDGLSRALKRIYDRSPARVFLLTTPRLDCMILAEQLQACSRSGIEIDRVAWTSGKFVTVSSKISGFDISSIGLFDGRVVSAGDSITQLSEGPDKENEADNSSLSQTDERETSE